MFWYKTGTIALTNGSKVVTGTSTQLSRYVIAGEGLVAPDGKLYEIEKVNSATELELTQAYAGPTVSGEKFVVAPFQGYNRDISIKVSELIDKYTNLPAEVGQIIGGLDAAVAAVAESQRAAAESASQSAASAATSLQSKGDAAGSAAEASQSAANASASAKESLASESASDVSQKAAAVSASAASFSERAAALSATDAASSQDAAKESAAKAFASEEASAASAHESGSQAALSAESAVASAESASDAASSESAAAESASDALVIKGQTKAIYDSTVLVKRDVDTSQTHVDQQVVAISGMRDDALSARDSAEASKDAASNSAIQAVDSASAASKHSESADQSAKTASGHRDAAKASAESSAESAHDADLAKNFAQQAQVDANQARAAAQAAQENALVSNEAAAASAIAAEASRAGAAESQASASVSQVAAEASAAAAKKSAEDAARSVADGVIKDDTTALGTTWSSTKIDGEITAAKSALSDQINSKTQIDDGEASTDKVWSSEKVQTAIEEATAPIQGQINDSLTPLTARVVGAEKKLAGIEDGATKNATDAQLRDRNTHTGTQPISTIEALQDALDAKVSSEIGKGLSTEDYSTSEKNKLAGVAAGATANATDASLRNRATHIGTQEIATVAGLQGVLDSKLPLTGGTMNGQLIGQKRSLSMSGAAVDGGDGNGSFVARSSSTGGDANLAGMTFWHDAYAIRMGVRNDGYFGLGSYSRAAWSLYSDPAGNLVAAGNIQAYSDPDLKDNVVPITNALELIAKLDGVRFVWNHKTELIGKPGQADVGVLADQVEAVLPEAVSRSIPDEANDGHQWRTVDYSKLVPLLIQGLKEVIIELQALKRSNQKW